MEEPRDRGRWCSRRVTWMNLIGPGLKRIVRNNKPHQKIIVRTNICFKPPNRNSFYGVQRVLQILPATQNYPSQFPKLPLPPVYIHPFNWQPTGMFAVLTPQLQTPPLPLQGSPAAEVVFHFNYVSPRKLVAH